MTQIWRVLRAPITLIALCIGGILMFLFLAAISVGGWYDNILQRLNSKTPGWIPALFGILTFMLVGIVIPAVALRQLLGWPGTLLGPTLMVLLVALLDHW